MFRCKADMTFGQSDLTELQAIDLQGHSAPPVRLATAAPPGDLPELQRWRAAVGPVRMATVARRVSARTAGWPLTIVAWNTNVGGGALRTLWDHLTAGRDTAAGPTVLLLQEVFATGPQIPGLTPGAAWATRITAVPPDEERTDIVTFARDTGLSLLYTPSMRNGGPRPGAPGGPPEDRGNAILANLPLSAPQAIELPFERQRRVAVAADVTIADTTITLCSIHLDNRSQWSRAWRTLGAGRRRQMAGLLEVFPGPAAEHQAHILGGDLNTWVGGRRESACRLARFRFPLPVRPDRRPTHHLEIGGWLRHSDHLMFRLPSGWRGACHRADATFGSDHYPLVGTVEPCLP